MSKKLNAIGTVIAVIAAFALAPGQADARVFIGVGLGPWWGPWYYPPPVYYAPPVVYPPPTVVYTQPPAPTPVAPSAASQSWYYCDNPEGYYPYVRDCPSGWRTVAPTPPR